MSHAHNTLTTLISSSETRIETKLGVNDIKMNEMRTIFSDNNYSQKQLQNSVTEMMKKFEKGIGKGTVSEHITYNILYSLFPCAQIDYVGDIKEMGDILFMRKGMPKILIENKDHDSCNVPKSDVEKFIRDCGIQNCCGIMFAQNSGIVHKRNFEIQINNGNVLLYVTEVKFEVDKIKTAIDIVEQFKIKLDEINIGNDNNYSIEHDILEEINKEFNNYIQPSAFEVFKDKVKLVNKSMIIKFIMETLMQDSALKKLSLDVHKIISAYLFNLNLGNGAIEDYVDATEEKSQGDDMPIIGDGIDNANASEFSF